MPDIADMKTALLAMLSDGEIRAILLELLGVEEKEKEMAELTGKVAAQRTTTSDQEQRLPSVSVSRGPVFRRYRLNGPIDQNETWPQGVSACDLIFRNILS